MKRDTFEHDVLQKLERFDEILGGGNWGGNNDGHGNKNLRLDAGG